MVLIVTYDLHAPGRDYEKVAAVLQTARDWAHPQGSVWLLDTDRDPAGWRDLLTKSGDANDEYFVCQLTHNWASKNLDAEAAAWLKSSSRTW